MAEQQSGKLFTFFSFFKMKSNIRSWRKNLSFMNFSRGNISNTRKALTEKNGIWNVSIMASAREVPDSNWHISSSTNSGYREQKWFFGQDFSLSVSSFDVVSKIEFVMFVQYPQWNFLSYWKWPIINFLNMPSQDTLHRFEMKLW